MRRSVLVAAFGTVVERYDFSLYLYLTPVVARVFFHDDHSPIRTYPVFAIAYLAAGRTPSVRRDRLSNSSTTHCQVCSA